MDDPGNLPSPSAAPRKRRASAAPVHRPTSGVPGGVVVRGWLIAIVCGLVAVVVASRAVGPALRLLFGWDVAIFVLVGLQWRRILRSTPARCRRQSEQDDPGDVGLLLVSLATSAASLAGAVFVLANPERASSTWFEAVGPWLAIGAVVGGWFLMQTAFTFHYARQYYGGVNEDPGGLKFLGGPPDDLDFAYFAFGVGVAFQVADIAVTSRQIRRTVLFQSVLSFGYNAAILALMINLVANHLGA
ncbi:MAG TPA: DUF1345 domain-containing protein [Thermomicrobiales bacterium]|nr:DUF1345 domain-containing protein [Thermomicrobiales bacterium]